MTFLNRLHHATAWLCLALVGCQDDLPRISLVSEMDLFGHRVEVAEDSTRATPAPGETARIAWSVLYPEIDADNDSNLSLLALECSMPERYTGQPICQEFLSGGLEGLLEDSPLGDGEDGETAPANFRCTEDATLPLGPLTLHCLQGHTDTEFTVAKDFEGSARLFVGILCRHGVAELGADGFTCSEGEGSGELEEEAFFSSVAIEDEDNPRNLNPEADALAVRYREDVLWRAWDGETLPTEESCDETSAALPEFPAGEEVTLALGYAASDRERVAGDNELVRISHRATAGSFESSATYIRRDKQPDEDDLLTIETTWTMPEAEEEGERLIRFYFGIRDGRGGFATTERFACRP